MCLAIDIRVECLTWSFLVVRTIETAPENISVILLLSQELILFIALVIFVDRDLLDPVLGLFQTALHLQINTKVLNWCTHFLQEDLVLLQLDYGVVNGWCLGVLVFTVLKITTNVTALDPFSLIRLHLLLVIF